MRYLCCGRILLKGSHYQVRQWYPQSKDWDLCFITVSLLLKVLQPLHNSCQANYTPKCLIYDFGMWFTNGCGFYACSPIHATDTRKGFVNVEPCGLSCDCLNWRAFQQHTNHNLCRTLMTLDVLLWKRFSFFITSYAVYIPYLRRPGSWRRNAENWGSQNLCP